MHTTKVHHLTIARWERDVAGEEITIACPEGIATLAPRLGPTGTLTMHQCSHLFDSGAIAISTSYTELAARFGVGTSAMVRTIERMVRFGYARWADPACEVLEIATRIGRCPLADVVTLAKPPQMTSPLNIA